jgi:hypothetical protein
VRRRVLDAVVTKREAVGSIARSIGFQNERPIPTGVAVTKNGACRTEKWRVPQRSTYTDAVGIANDSIYGLGRSIFSGIRRAKDIARASVPPRSASTAIRSPSARRSAA